MRYILILTALLSQAVYADSKILINKSDQRYVVIPDCQVQEDVTDIMVETLKGRRRRSRKVRQKARAMRHCRCLRANE